MLGPVERAAPAEKGPLPGVPLAGPLCVCAVEVASGQALAPSDMCFVCHTGKSDDLPPPLPLLFPGLMDHCVDENDAVRNDRIVVLRRTRPAHIYASAAWITPAKLVYGVCSQ